MESELNKYFFFKAGIVGQRNLCQYCTFTKREQQRHAVRASGKGPFYTVSRNILPSLLESIFYLPLNVMNVVQLLFRFIVIDDVCFMDHIFVFQMFMYNMFPHSLWLHLGYMLRHLLKHCCFSFLLETFFNGRICINEFSLAKVIKMYLTFLVLLNALAWDQLCFWLTWKKKHL